ncbi:histidine phosphatase family protein [Anaerocolumna sp. AGMB13025]|uniref:histidine phosphatase family protein n=1 Tax=Anaerocolumna sp. AGMB13025 TaxID=3039116 RepID=UPI00241CF054|nr:histidine phosphatase family protein [Anaerocolumna sp. AGMB13025]WFR59700.1 histidine phosphatase family protein [Anaerocolumna sp. AGMB13025]
MNIYLIRHGWQNSPLCNADVELSPEGFQQADLLGKRLASYEIDGLYSSHLIRAVQTAEVINLYIRQQHNIRENLREISFGELEGHTSEYIAEHFAEFKTKQMKLESDLAYPGGECGRDVFQRSIVTIDEIVHSGKKKVAVVTHGGVIRALLTGLIGLDMNKKLLFAYSLENTSITELVYDESYERFYLQRFNDTAHLEGNKELFRHNW